MNRQQNRQQANAKELKRLASLAKAEGRGSGVEVGVDMPEREVGFRVKEVGPQLCGWDLWDIEFGVWYASFGV